MSVVIIHHCAIPNGRLDEKGRPDGWLPMCWDNGWPSGGTWAAHGLDKGTAERVARSRASSIAERFIGDWDVRLVQGPCPDLDEKGAVPVRANDNTGESNGHT